MLLLLFFNCTTWLLGSIVFMKLEGATETKYKCGVMRVRRNFIDDLWNETQTLEELDWKSLARRKLITFEDELHQAVEAGVTSYSGQRSWTPANTFLYVFTLATTIGYGHLTPVSPSVRLLSVLFGCLATPLLALLVSEIASLLTSLLHLLAAAVRKNYSDCKGKVDLLTSTLLLLVGPDSADPGPGLFCVMLLSYTLMVSIIFSVVFFWNLYDSFYFVFSSVSTVGFGDVVPADSLIFLLLGGLTIIGLAIYSLYQDRMVALLSSWLEMADQRIISHMARNKNKKEQ